MLFHRYNSGNSNYLASLDLENYLELCTLLPNSPVVGESVAKWCLDPTSVCSQPRDGNMDEFVSGLTQPPTPSSDALT